jgi:hypothetical protein
MTWFEYLLISLLSLNVIVMILMVGKPREPVTPGVAVVTLVINSALILGVITQGA